jgi:uncharacterized protein YbjT (DUF2867 family)
MARVFVNGGTGYIGRPLIETLTGRGHEVTAVVRAQSAARLPKSCRPVIGDALDASTYREHVTHEHTFVQLVGVPHPSPKKAREFVEIDGRSAREAVRAAREARVPHFVYVSVAHPAPVMKTYIEVRAGCEVLIREAGLRATILRPWYVLGPGRRWPVALLPLYWVAARVPRFADGARRLGLVSLEEMVGALVRSIENPPEEMRTLEPSDIRAWARHRDTDPLGRKEQ